MLIEILKQFNWLDFLVAILIIRIVYIALNSNFPLELFKLLGTFASSYLSLHYFTFFTDWLGQRNPGVQQKVPLQFMDFISFITLAVIGYLLFVALRLVFDSFIKMEIPRAINKWLALSLGAIRGLFLASLVTFAIAISSVAYLEQSVKDSFMGRRIINVAPRAYIWTWGRIVSRFAIGEDFNQTVVEVQKNINP